MLIPEQIYLLEAGEKYLPQGKTLMQLQLNIYKFLILRVVVAEPEQLSILLLVV